MLELTTPVQYVKGIGPKLAEILATKGITTVGDLLHYLPFRYEDRLNPRGIAELRAGEMATVIGEVRNSGLFRTRRMPIFQLTVGQGRSKLKCLWFNATYLQDKFKPGQLVALYGKVEQDSRSGELQIMQPQVEMLGDAPGEAADDKAAASLEVGRIVPIYESAGQGQSNGALVSACHSHRAGRSNSRVGGNYSCRGARAYGADLATGGAVENSLAGSRREFSRLAIVAHAGAYPLDL